VLIAADTSPSSHRSESQAAVEALLGSGPGDDQSAAMLSASAAEYDIADVRSLTQDDAE
jgi:hypothetical protein